MNAPANAIRESAASLTLRSWLQFIIGGRDAMLAVTKSPAALWLGLLFVLSAGFAREYDGRYLAREPWHLILPLVASLATSLLLYTFVFLTADSHGVTTLTWWRGYRAFLACYWMTAPLAWLYAIPCERFLAPASATEFNLWLLAIVSVWRVLLITRVISVWFSVSFLRTIWLVLFFGDTVLLIASFVTPTPIWDVMGGIRLPEREGIVLEVKLSIFVFGSMAWCLLAIATTVALCSGPAWQDSSSNTPRHHIHSSLWAFACVLLLAGIGVLPLFQSEQARRWHAEQLLRTGQIEEALRFMAETPHDKFPPIWDPPPHTSYEQDLPPLETIMTQIDRIELPTWIRDTFLEKVLTSHVAFDQAVAMAEEGSPNRLSALLDFLQRSNPAGIGGEYWYKWKEVAANTRIDNNLRKRIDEYLERSRPR